MPVIGTGISSTGPDSPVVASVLIGIACVVVMIIVVVGCAACGCGAGGKKRRKGQDQDDMATGSRTGSSISHGDLDEGESTNQPMKSDRGGTKQPVSMKYVTIPVDQAQQMVQSHPTGDQINYIFVTNVDYVEPRLFQIDNSPGHTASEAKGSVTGPATKEIQEEQPKAPVAV